MIELLEKLIHINIIKVLEIEDYDKGIQWHKLTFFIG